MNQRAQELHLGGLGETPRCAVGPEKPSPLKCDPGFAGGLWFAAAADPAPKATATKARAARVNSFRIILSFTSF